MSVTAPLAGHAGRAPGRTALIFENDRLTWSELDRTMARLASWIAAQTPDGVGVALHLPSGPALALLFLAVAHAGREAQILDASWPDGLRDAALEELAPALIVSTVEGLKSIKRAVVLPDAFGTMSELADTVGAPAEATALPMPAASAPFYVGFTSGSTGVPKGFRRGHSSWTASFKGADAEFGIGPKDVVLAAGTLTHSLFLYAVASGLHAGATVVLTRGFWPGAVRLIPAHGVSVIYAVPTQLDVMTDAAELAGLAPFGSVRWVLSSGAKFPESRLPKIRRSFPGARFAEFYGASELSFVALARDDEPVPSGSVGRAFPGVSISIRDRRGRRLPEGREGLVYVESPLVFLGYATGTGDLHRAGEEVSVGDRGYLDESGFLHLVGRDDRMTIVSGRNIHPEEIEGALERHPAVAAAGVISVPDERRGVRLIGLIHAEPGPKPSRAELTEHLLMKLPSNRVPKVFALVREWPRTRSGKTDIATLETLWRDGSCEVLT
ncbi:AMP-binding protein [Flaviflagellibacter deserti]|uniref:AMP-binding protein n=1 Tax=Flaviflagellibacter deserti TaxID=2267266 RepID=A0ABV9Z416_9HYPH